MAEGTRQPQGPSPKARMPAAIESVPSGGWASERPSPGFQGEGWRGPMRPWMIEPASCT